MVTDTAPESRQAGTQPEAQRAGPRWDGGLRYERIGVLEAIWWRKWTVMLAVLLFVAAAVAWGLTRNPVYTSSARLSVQVSATSPVTLPGSITAAESLASTYSRQIDARKVTRLIAKRIGDGGRGYAGKVSAAPVPNSSVMNVSATTDSERTAVELANAAAAAMQRYVQQLRRPQLGSEGLLEQYENLTARFQNVLSQTRELEERTEGSPTPREQAVLEQLRTQEQTLTVQRSALQTAYTNAQRFYTAPLETLRPATMATSDRMSKLQLFIVLGILAGLATGAAFATMRANRIAGSWDTSPGADGVKT